MDCLLTTPKQSLILLNLLRYNSNDRNALMTWQLLGDAVYNYTSFGAADATLIRGRFISRPSVSEDLQSYWYNVSR